LPTNDLKIDKLNAGKDLVFVCKLLTITR